jgi:hypothetical protein
MSAVESRGRRFMVVLRHRLPGSCLRSIEGRFEGPQISIAHNLAERFSISRNAAADQRAGIPDASSTLAECDRELRNAAHEVACG